MGEKSFLYNRKLGLSALSKVTQEAGGGARLTPELPDPIWCLSQKPLAGFLCIAPVSMSPHLLVTAP